MKNGAAINLPLANGPCKGQGRVAEHVLMHLKNACLYGSFGPGARFFPGATSLL